eukprot:1463997-Prymnesium_polylepis.1
MVRDAGTRRVPEPHGRRTYGECSLTARQPHGGRLRVHDRMGNRRHVRSIRAVDTSWWEVTWRRSTAHAD